MRFGFPVVVALFFLLTACSGSNGTSDGFVDDGERDGSDGANAGDEGDEERVDGGDYNPGPPFRLVFEDGAQACARFADRRTAAQELALRGRIRFVPQTVELPRDADTIRVDLIQTARIIGPVPVEAVVVGPGEIVHDQESAVWGWCHHYTYTQLFDANSVPFTVKAVFSFCYRTGVTDPQELVFDADRPGDDPRGLVDESQVQILGLLNHGMDYLTERQFYRSCTYPTLPRFEVTAKLSADDGIVIDKRLMHPLMGSGPAAIMGARIDLDGERRTIDDYFRFAYGADLHNFNERYIVTFDPPIGQVHGVHFQETNQDDPPAQIDLLGSDLDPENPLEQRAVESYSDLAL